MKLVLPLAHLSDRPGNHALEPVGLGASRHGVRLAGSGLSVGHDGTVVAVQEPRDHAPRTPPPGWCCAAPADRPTHTDRQTHREIISKPGILKATYMYACTYMYTVLIKVPEKIYTTAAQYT